MSRHDFGHIPVRECGEALVRTDPREFPQEPKYFERRLCTTPDMYLRAGTLELLRKAIKSLPKGHNFKLWDCYRSLETQRNLFELCKRGVATQHPTWNAQQVYHEARKFIAIPDRPEEIPPHNTGGTVDLTIVNESGEELNMGTDFDEFGDRCHPYFFHETSARSVEEDAIVRNRDMLFSAMLSAGFRQDTDEWWHFDYGNQLWALELKKSYAIYGSAEKLYPKP